ncbi:hypothetical protein B0T14DRAFT_114327 [Immersiella caudata]|uniref:Secreted protein n=1 Tax=Immersiella caudata TaxID=314043 RepID=A0AA39X3P6_9PEZI|nr:hypothetical protein B0T14DRAFT_114327 [Immersiella caudata]
MQLGRLHWLWPVLLPPLACDDRPCLSWLSADGWHLPSMPAFPISDPRTTTFEVWTDKTIRAHWEGTEHANRQPLTPRLGSPARHAVLSCSMQGNIVNMADMEEGRPMHTHSRCFSAVLCTRKPASSAGLAPASGGLRSDEATRRRRGILVITFLTFTAALSSTPISSERGGVTWARVTAFLFDLFVQDFRLPNARPAVFPPPFRKIRHDIVAGPASR